MRAHMWSFVLILLVAFAVLAAPTASVQSSCVGGLTDADTYTNDNTTFCEVTPSDLCGVFTPLLSPWAAALLVSVLVFAGFVFLRRRTKAANALCSVILLFTVLVTSFYITAWTVQAHEFITSEDNVIEHYHRPRDGERQLRPVEKECINGMVELAYPAATRTNEPTVAYNAHGVTFDNSISWINSDQVPTILNDDYVLVTGDKQLDDVIIYDRTGEKIGSGIVTAVNEGNVTEVESKWGIAGTYKHAPDYGPYWDLAPDTTYYRHE